MSDIFISYSRKDAEQASMLAEMLASAGLSCWIDEQGIEAATSWSGEISKAITDCTALIVLLSPSSVDSKNVTREVALAFERNKKILPIDIEPVILPDDFAYHLAGLQRTSMTNIDSVIRALSKLGLEATGAPQAPKIVKEDSGKKSLMVMPFEDLSPAGDNQWFADGLASELVSTLSNVKPLKLIDWNTSKMLRNKSIKTVEIAREFDVRYFIEGQVRKFGDQIKISVTLLDIETGDHLWQDSLRGTMQDIFDIQEETAQKVVEGLKLHLTTDEQKKLRERGTENVEAYECHVKGIEYFARQTRSDYERALALDEEAIRLDPKFARAYTTIAITSREMYRSFDRNPVWLDRATAAAEHVRSLEGETVRYYWLMSLIRLQRGDAAGALQLAQQGLNIGPKNSSCYDAIAFASMELGDLAGAVAAMKESVRLMENNRIERFNLLVALSELATTGRTLEERSEREAELREEAEQAIPIFARQVRLNPDDYLGRVELAMAFQYADRREEALREAAALAAFDALEGKPCYNLACLFLNLGHPERGIVMLRRAVEKGYRNIENFRRDPDLAPLRGTPEFEALMKELEVQNA